MKSVTVYPPILSHDRFEIDEQIQLTGICERHDMCSGESLLCSFVEII